MPRSRRPPPRSSSAARSEENQVDTAVQGGYIPALKSAQAAFVEKVPAAAPFVDAVDGRLQLRAARHRVEHAAAAVRRRHPGGDGRRTDGTGRAGAGQRQVTADTLTTTGRPGARTPGRFRRSLAARQRGELWGFLTPAIVFFRRLLPVPPRVRRVHEHDELHDGDVHHRRAPFRGDGELRGDPPEPITFPRPGEHRHDHRGVASSSSSWGCSSRSSSPSASPAAGGCRP